MSVGDASQVRPRTCVWEITLACNARCRHCGSSAGQARPGELDEGEALQLVEDLAALGCESVTLSGGEPLVRPDWPAIARAVVQRRMRLELVTNGLPVIDQVDAIADAGFHSVTFSLDGTRSVHDGLRGVCGGFDRLLAGAQALIDRGVRIAANTQVNRENLSELEALHDVLTECGFGGWQLQLTMAHGRARTDRRLCLAPSDLPGLAARICALRSRSPLLILVGDNIGYLGRSEPKLRTPTGSPVQLWTGCHAGLSVIGLRSDGTVLGCLSLPDAFIAGNVRQRPLGALWADDDAFAYSRKFRASMLTGACAGCALGRICRGGCRSLAWSATGAPFSNPYCLHRVERGRAP
jgi:radical SAM protein with 4Fe4S-binding SPASM domain